MSHVQNITRNDILGFGSKEVENGLPDSLELIVNEHNCTQGNVTIFGLMVGMNLQTVFKRNWQMMIVMAVKIISPNAITTV